MRMFNNPYTVLRLGGVATLHYGARGAILAWIILARRPAWNLWLVGECYEVWK